MTTERDHAEDLMKRIRRGEDITDDELKEVLTMADRAGILYYSMLTMAREQRSLTELPDKLKQVIKLGAWKRWRWVGSSFGQASLSAYLTKPPPNGIGIRLETVEKLIADDPEAQTMFREEMKVGQGKRTDLVDIINEVKPTKGTSRAYTLDRLKRERPDLFSRVAAKELSANAAAIEAGFRKKPSALEAALKAFGKLTDAERREFLNAIGQ
jgi:hypothetical protein